MACSRLLLAATLLASLTGCPDDRNTAGPAGESLGEEPRQKALGKIVDEGALNVILITVDTLRADALGGYGQKRFTSPNIDLFSQQGVLFSQATTSAPSTLPSHASIMTARHPYAHGARANAGYLLAKENETLAEILQRSGYRTGAEIAANVIGHGSQLNQGFDQYRDLSSANITRKTISVIQKDGSQREVALEERPAQDITKFGIEFLRQPDPRPFFLWLHYFDPHAHYTAPKEYQNLISDSPYHAEVRYVDAEIGRLLRHLTQLGLDEKTIVVITADHGESLNEHDESTHSAFVYQSTMHVPLIFRGPLTKFLRDWRVDAPVRTIDIAPTILDLAGLPPFAEAQGRSLTALMNGERSDLHLTGYGESLELQSMFGTSILRFLRRDQWKYVHQLKPALYDLTADPRELQNLADTRPDRVQDLAEALREEIRSAPKKPGRAELVIDEETIRQLRALGYLSAGPAAESADEVASLELKGPNPSALSGDHQIFGQAWYHSSIGEYAKAAAIFADLAERHPKSLTILTDLADSMIQLEKYSSAVEILQRAIEVHPDYEKTYNLLARAEEALGHFEEAEAAARQSLERQPCAGDSRMRLAALLGRADRTREQLETLRDGAEACPDAYEVLNNYAYLLSTSPKPEIRNGREAVRIAKLAVEKSGGLQPSILDTLAGAHAEAGHFELALKISRRAVELARTKNMDRQIIDALQQNRTRFEQRRPSRQE
jgi:arylsulfatase A-like enzyme